MSELSERQAGEGMLFTMMQDLIRHVLSSELCVYPPAWTGYYGLTSYSYGVLSAQPLHLSVALTVTVLQFRTLF